MRDDRTKVEKDGFWIYHDLPLAFQRAEETKKPLIVVLRCIPCKECVKLDDDLVDQDPAIRSLLEQFVCVRVVALALSLFQLSSKLHRVCDDGGALLDRLEPESVPLVDLHVDNAEIEGDSL